MATNYISKETLVPLGAVAAVCVVVFSAALWINNTVKDQQQFNDQILTKMDALGSQLELAATDRYTKTAASEVAGRNALLNQTQVVVDPRDPDKVMPNTAGIQYMERVGGPP